MLEHLKAEDRYGIGLSYAYRIVGRTALIAAFLLAIGGELRGAIASLVVAFWMVWSTQNLFTVMIGKDIETLCRQIELMIATSAVLETEKHTEDSTTLEAEKRGEN